MIGYRIREAREQDGAEISRLAGQLGYPTPNDVMKAEPPAGSNAG
jgi:hypothetical protein